jgi:ParD-like antitoxin of type II bacterial toxin-antitoxin system
MSTATPFASVKLPAALVDKAREAAQPMRRSVASQIEYWATLGRALEQAGLSTQDSQALIAREESAAYAVEVNVQPALSPELDALHGHVLALAQSGALAERAKAAVAENRAKASPRARGRNAA